MTGTDRHAIETRLARIELELAKAHGEIQRLRRSGLTRGACAAALVLAAVAATAGSPMAQGSSRVKAPFEVVDGKGRTIMLVREGSGRGFAIFNDSGQPVVFGSALPNGVAVLKTASPDEKEEALLGINPGQFVGFTSRLNKRDRASLGINISSRLPSLGLNNGTGASIIAIEQGATTGGGCIQVADASGNANRRGGRARDGRGSREGASVGSPGAGLVGMPGTFLLGRK